MDDLSKNLLFERDFKKSDRENGQVDENVRLRVIVINEILGNSERIMTIDEIKKFNIPAYMCAKRVLKFGNAHSMGMWTVEVA